MPPKALTLLALAGQRGPGGTAVVQGVDRFRTVTSSTQNRSLSPERSGVERQTRGQSSAASVSDPSPSVPRLQPLPSSAGTGTDSPQTLHPETTSKMRAVLHGRPGLFSALDGILSMSAPMPPVQASAPDSESAKPAANEMPGRAPSEQPLRALDFLNGLGKEKVVRSSDSTNSLRRLLKPKVPSLVQKPTPALEKKSEPVPSDSPTSLDMFSPSEPAPIPASAEPTAQEAAPEDIPPPPPVSARLSTQNIWKEKLMAQKKTTGLLKKVVPPVERVQEGGPLGTVLDVPGTVPKQIGEKFGISTEMQTLSDVSEVPAVSLASNVPKVSAAIPRSGTLATKDAKKTSASNSPDTAENLRLVMEKARLDAELYQKRREESPAGDAKGTETRNRRSHLATARQRELALAATRMRHNQPGTGARSRSALPQMSATVARRPTLDSSIQQRRGPVDLSATQNRLRTLRQGATLRPPAPGTQRFSPTARIALPERPMRARSLPPRTNDAESIRGRLRMAPAPAAPAMRGKDWRHGRHAIEEETFGRGRTRGRRGEEERRGRRGEENLAYGTLDDVRERIRQDIMIPASVSVVGLADLLRLPVGKVQRKMQDMGMQEKETFMDYRLTPDMASLVVLEFNHNPVISNEPAGPSLTPEQAIRMTQVTDLVPRPEPESWADYPERPPVVAIMGHVDHGKTTLLDTLRATSVAAGEAGGITQHIGAFTFVPPGSSRAVTFLDTPGHAAFTTMRARGAKATDIVVLVVAADDGVMPQTVESIRLAQEAGSTIVVAINKCDKPQADPTKVQEKLLAHGIQTEEFGGDVPAVPISALKNTGLDMLVETIVTMAEVELDVRGDPTGPVEGVVLESRMDKGRGVVATVLVRRGTLKPGKTLVCGTTYCKVRRMDNENGAEVDVAGPAIPVEIIGWKEQPSAGDIVVEAPDETTARRVVENRQLKAEFDEEVKSLEGLNESRAKHRELRKDGISTDQALLEQTKQDVASERAKNQTVTVIVKADVDGSLEAITESLQKLPQDEVTVYIVDSGVGPINESDLMKADVSGAMLVTFNVPLEKKMAEDAGAMKIEIREHNIIYKLLDDIKELMSERLPPLVKVDITAEANIQATFEISVKKGKEKVAGCKIDTGKLQRKSKIRVIRDRETIWEGGIRSLKHFKKEVDEVVKGQECGVALDGFEGFEAGDLIQAFVVTETKRKIA